MVLDDNQKIGVLLTGVGVFFTTLGVLMLFDRGLLAIGNLLFLAGVTLVIGVHKTYRFFFQKRKIRGTSCFLGGIFLVLMGWAFIGMCVEVWGFINLFGYEDYLSSAFNSMRSDFFPIALSFLRRIPIIGTILNLPYIKEAIDRVVSGGSLPV